MKTCVQEFQEASLDRLRPHPRNPRRGDVAAIRRSIRANGWFGAVIAQKSTGHILAGNHRYLAARREGAKTVPVVWLDVDDAAALRILLVDNRTADLAGTEDESLANLLRDLAEDTGSLAGTGYSGQELEALLDKLNAQVDEDEAEDQSAELGNVWQIVVDCASEAEQQELLAKLSADGFDCKALVG